MGNHYCGWTKSCTTEETWNDDSPINANKQWLFMVSNGCKVSSIHSMIQPKGHSNPRSGSAISIFGPTCKQASVVAGSEEALQGICVTNAVCFFGWVNEENRIDFALFHSFPGFVWLGCGLVPVWKIRAAPAAPCLGMLDSACSIRRPFLDDSSTTLPATSWFFLQGVS